MAPDQRNTGSNVKNNKGSGSTVVVLQVRNPPRTVAGAGTPSACLDTHLSSLYSNQI